MSRQNKLNRRQLVRQGRKTGRYHFWRLVMIEGTLHKRKDGGSCGKVEGV